MNGELAGLVIGKGTGNARNTLSRHSVDSRNTAEKGKREEGMNGEEVGGGKNGKELEKKERKERGKRASKGQKKGKRHEENKGNGWRERKEEVKIDK